MIFSPFRADMVRVPVNNFGRAVWRGLVTAFVKDIVALL